MTTTAQLIADAYLTDALHWLAAADTAAAEGNSARAANYQLLADESLARAGL